MEREALNPALKVQRMLLKKYAQQRYREDRAKDYKLDSFAISENAKAVSNLKTWQVQEDLTIEEMITRGYKTAPVVKEGVMHRMDAEIRCRKQVCLCVCVYGCVCECVCVCVCVSVCLCVCGLAQKCARGYCPFKMMRVCVYECGCVLCLCVCVSVCMCAVY